MPLPQEALDAVAHNNVKTVGESAAFFTSLLFQSAVSDNAAMGEIRRAATAQAVKGLLEADPVEAVSTIKMLSGNDTALQLAQLLAALTSGQQSVKAAQTTPPVTP